jgi:site-specific recombinase
MLPAAAGDVVPDLHGFCELVTGGAEPRPVRELYAWFCALDDAAPLPGRLKQLREGARWLRARGVLTVGPIEHDEPRELRRLRLMVASAERVPSFGARLRALCASVLAETHALDLLGAGLPNQRGVGAEAADRLARRFLPSPPRYDDLGELIDAMFPSLRDAEWLRALDAELAARTAAALGLSLGGALDEALALAATRVSALGLSDEIRARGSGSAVLDSPFYRLPRALDDDEILVFIDACRAELTNVTSHLEEYGVSIDVVYRLEVMAANLDRMELLVAARAKKPRAGVELLATTVAARAHDHRLRDLWRDNAHLLARKIVEHTGKSGEHYITSSKREWVSMLLSAAGGGVLTAFTTVFKYAVTWLKLPLFVEGFLSSTNYAVSFLLMQFFGFTLATKQPSMTAAALAGALKGVGKGDPATSKITPDALEPLVTMIARICRSQLAAAIGNVLFVIPAALVFDQWWRQRTGRPFLDEATAAHTIHSFHPLETGMLGFAALTGVLLWLSSLGAGWLENWMTYRHIHEAIAEHRLGRIVGRRTLRWLSRKLAHGMSGIGGNVTLGFLLGMVPVFGKFLGLPLEVRHVTLSTGGLTLAGASLGIEAHGLLPAAIGIACIGLLNFGVSFVLALGMALRARTVEHVGWRLFGAVLRRFYRAPLEFFLPTEKDYSLSSE